VQGRQGIEGTGRLKSHTVAEKLVKSCVSDIATTIIGNEARKELELEPFSNNVIQR